MNEYPRMMYRDGDEIDVNGVQVDILIVGDAEQQAEAMANGWRTLVAGEAYQPSVLGTSGLLEGSLPKRRGRPPKDVATIE